MDAVTRTVQGGKMKIDVSKDITVSKPTPLIKKWAHDYLTLDNPEYYKKERLGKYTGNIPRQIKLYETVGGDLILPFGVIREVFATFGKECEITPHFDPFRRVEYQSHINLYPYQETAVNEAIRLKNGVIVMPCGAGKTQTAIEIIARLGGRALWLTHTQDLLNQSMNRAKSVLDIAEDTYGTITAGKVNIGSGITFATVQTMSKIDLPKYKDAFDIVVVDECHKAIGSPSKIMQFYKVVSNLNARYKYGITATPTRSDGLSKSMFALLGGLICTITRDQVKNTTCPVKVESYETKYYPDEVSLNGDGTINYAGLVGDLTHDDMRFEVVFARLTRLKGAVLVLANRVEYLKTMCHTYVKNQWGSAVCLSDMGHSKKAKEERKRVLNALNTGELDCVFATYQLAAEGLDCPNLRYVVLATPEKDERIVTQAVGRVERKAAGKDHGTIIDFVDDFGMFRGWYKKRLSFYKKLGFDLDGICQ